MDALAAADLWLIAFGTVAAITLDHRACRRIDDDADAMLLVVDAVLAEEAAPSGEVAHESRDDRAEEFRRAVTTTGRR
jgi:hypothetical protein